VYAPSNSSTAFLEQLRKPLLETIIGDSYVACDERAPLSDCGSGLDQGTMSCDVRIEKKSYFNVTNARDALSHVRVLRDIQMDMNADAQVCAGGALCAILAKVSSFPPRMLLFDFLVTSSSISLSSLGAISSTL
jgi:hypothetical protein